MTINKNTNNIEKKLKEKNIITEKEKGMFIIKDVILIEKYTGKTHTYWAYNYKTEEKKYLGSRKKEIRESDYSKYENKIINLDIYKKVEIPKASELVDYIFRNIFSTYGYKVREDQIKLSKRIYENLNKEEILLSDIPVGFGKTHAYLVAIIAYKITSKDKKPIIISTSSKQLQNEIKNN